MARAPIGQTYFAALRLLRFFTRATCCVFRRRLFWAFLFFIIRLPIALVARAGFVRRPLRGFRWSRSTASSCFETSLTAKSLNRMSRHFNLPVSAPNVSKMQAI